MTDRLSQETERLTKLLIGKTVKAVRRHRGSELLIEFADGTRLFVDSTNAELDVSVTGGSSSDHSG